MKLIHFRMELQMNTYIKKLIDDDSDFQEIIRDIISNKTVQKMKNFMQHYDTTCFDHCYVVSYYCYLICKRLNLDYKSAARAGMLHDFFLYDWRKKQPDRKGLHAFTHGKIACENACKLFNLNDKEKDMIIKHMWPVTVALPNSLEGLILTFVDKYCAISESIDILKTDLFSRKSFRHAYLVLSLLNVNI